ncbi:FadR/GntR family transcriptional regulator [Mucilaginibacter lappiensis]|uniref:DNA-binding FadR family transcriptional regulator n=1 Tax=Mucilaginibacter lappiensis TaxID=354630 RepID=A0A1N7D1H2_9SPHI|nr:FadR/GntR family transcriptional regulator [Mucilaginibacter lappiensis]MBB6111121.1 DNA-binding FadR family transcriptional regulator [Mucilaginibacter lappiensis]MBB6128755.1 DNA-binding FadR family transcriptional regulator [Mucilaginibacter lappiensis]SIR69736.1 DNA-binding transcriptional regulator, FadR family [Mucilaginibacter lappiensis]
MMMNVIHKRSLAEEVAEQLRKAIADGKYKTGEQLPTEPELMKQFGVGRSSVREAIRILANSGLLRVQQGVGTFIEAPAGINEPFHQRLKRAEAHDLDEVRQLLEMKIAEKAAANRTEADLKKIKAKLDKRTAMAFGGSMEECIEADIEFHMSIAEAAGNPILTDLYQSFSIQLKSWFLKIYPDVTIFQDTLHAELYESIKNRDEKKAWDCITQIIQR